VSCHLLQEALPDVLALGVASWIGAGVHVEELQTPVSGTIAVGIVGHHDDEIDVRLGAREPVRDRARQQHGARLRVGLEAPDQIADRFLVVRIHRGWSSRPMVGPAVASTDYTLRAP
jgi:hypothetical protein